MEQEPWTALVDNLEVGASTVVKHGRRQLAVFRTDETRACVIDNRCPHEGYPLASGDVAEGVLTCAWHNWKFRLEDGVCIVGGEGVRRYESKIEGGQISARLVDPPVDELRAGFYASLLDAIDENDAGSAARSIERLLMSEEDPLAILGWMARAVARRLRWGFHHGLAASADLAVLLETEPPGLVLLQALELLFAGHERRPDVESGEPIEGDVGTLSKTILAEDLAQSEGLARAAEQGALFDALAVAATDGFLDFGHGLIFVTKAEELLDVVSDEGGAIRASLARSLVYSTREETLPTMRAFMKDVEARAPLELLEPSDAEFDARGFMNALLDGSLETALDAVQSSLQVGVAPDRVALACALGASQRLIRFDPAHEENEQIEETWLHVTHALTYAEALHSLLRVRPSNALLRGLWYAARFVQHLGPLDLDHDAMTHNAEALPAIDAARTQAKRSESDALPDAPDASGPRTDEVPTHGASEHGESSAAELIAALDARDAPKARTLVRRLPLPIVKQTLLADVLSDRMTRAIFVAHHVKMTQAVLRIAQAAEMDLALRPYARQPLEALVRWLCHPSRERRLRRTASVARRFVWEGKRARRQVK